MGLCEEFAFFKGRIRINLTWGMISNDSTMTIRSTPFAVLLRAAFTCIVVDVSLKISLTV